MEGLLNKVRIVKNMVTNYDKTANVEIVDEVRGFRINQTLSDGTSGVTLFFNKETEKVVFNHGWRMEETYLAGLCDTIIDSLIGLGLEDTDSSSLYSKSQSYKNHINA